MNSTLSPKSRVQVRRMREQDVPGILPLQIAIYPGTLHERAEFFLNRQALSPQTCWVAQEGDGGLLGYLIAYPWHDGLPPELDLTLPCLPEPATCWFLHDCAVHPRAQGGGIGRQLYDTAAVHAYEQGLRQARLVALAQAASYWRRLGYTDLPAPPKGLAAKLSGYGEGACYLGRELG